MCASGNPTKFGLQSPPKKESLTFKNFWGGYAPPPGVAAPVGNVVPSLDVDKNWFPALKLGIKLGTESPIINEIG